MRKLVFLLMLTVPTVGLIVVAGNLDPPGPPGPTMKTLAEIEPRIPISEPIVITEPGSYIVTKNISSTRYVIIVEDVPGPVSIDLNGFEVRCTGISPFQPIVAVSSAVVTIKNGFVSQANPSAAIFLSHTSALVENVVVNGGGGLLSYNARATTVRNSTWTFCSPSGGINFDNGLEIGAVLVENNLLEACGITVSGTTGARVTDNTMRRAGIALGQSTNCVVRDNTVSDSPGAGLVVGSRCHVERNVLLSNDGYGLVLEGNNNIYRGNTARGNSMGDFSDLGTGNTSAGDNYLPGVM